VEDWDGRTKFAMLAFGLAAAAFLVWSGKEAGRREALRYLCEERRDRIACGVLNGLADDEEGWKASTAR
jgi:hypothetical protein